MRRLLVIGGSHETAVGRSLYRAALAADVPVDYMSADEAYRAPRLIRAILWRCFDRRPARMPWFNKQVVQTCRREQISHLLCAGNLPLLRSTVEVLKSEGRISAAWLTDDPWNPAHGSQWLMNALSSYTKVFTPRLANLAQLERLAPGRVGYLPFGYEPNYFYPLEPSQNNPAKHDVFFAGGADPDRIHVMHALIQGGLNLGLYGDYWDRYPETKAAFGGYAKPCDMASLIAQSRLSLCLVRRANRDGHSMRTYELAAAGACILAEDTMEHRQLFGSDGEAVLYFRSDHEAVAKAITACESPQLCKTLQTSVLAVIRKTDHTYAGRLQSILTNFR